MTRTQHLYKPEPELTDRREMEAGLERGQLAPLSPSHPEGPEWFPLIHEHFEIPIRDHGHAGGL